MLDAGEPIQALVQLKAALEVAGPTELEEKRMARCFDELRVVEERWRDDPDGGGCARDLRAVIERYTPRARA